jgi:hypothetical protein
MKQNVRGKMTGTGYRIAIIIVCIVSAVTGCVCTGPDDVQSPDYPVRFSKQESLTIAEDLIINSPTFVFDGIPDSLSLKETLTSNCPSCWIFIFEFECSNAGYGDRTGQELATVITSHTATIAIQQGEIKAADLDRKWDILNQKWFQ